MGIKKNRMYLKKIKKKLKDKENLVLLCSVQEMPHSGKDQ